MTGRKPNRMVLIHHQHRTVHELRRDGTTYCGNGLPHLYNADAYDLLPFDKLTGPHRPCWRCEWILMPGRQRREAS